MHPVPRHPGFTHPRRGTMLVGVLVALSLFMLLVGAVVMSGARDNVQSVDRFAALRAEYNAEAAANIAIRELALNSDIDANGTIGTFNPANVATLNGGTMTTAASTVGSVTTIDASGRATGSNGASAAAQVASNNRLAVRRSTGGARPGLYTQVWFMSPTHPISSFDFNSAPSRIGWLPNIDFPNFNSGGNRIFIGHTANVQMRFIGQITLPTSGTWGFHADADDGVQVIVNGVSLFTRNTGGACARFNGSINLNAGTYSYELRWNDGAGSQCVTAYWTPPSGTISIIPPSAFSHVPLEATPALATIASTTIAGDGANTTLVQGWRNISGPWAGTPVADSATIYTDTNSNGSITLSSSARVEGIAYAPVGSTPSDVILTSGGATITGGRAVVPRRPLFPNPRVPTNMTAATENSVAFWGSTVTLTGDRRFQNLTIGTTSVATVSGNARIRVDGDLTIQDSARLVIPSGATLDLYVSGTVNIWTNAQVNTSGDPDRLRLYRIGTGTNSINVYDNGRLHAHVVSPYGALNLYDNSQANNEFVGTFRGASVNIDNNSKVRLDIGPAPGSSSSGSTSITSWIEP